MILRTRNGDMTAVTRRIFGVLIVCWLNLAILPCAMAFGGDDSCPHMQMATEQGQATHEGHHGSGTDADCASAPSDCCELDEATLDGRSDKFSDASDDFSATIPLSFLPTFASARTLPQETRPPDPGGSHTPIHVLKCVYLK